ncbi:MAG: MFS transporter [Caldisphaera sp.]|uniref:MFS transporter n=1 Tax=Caldisphaera sp. TaxID=2060322 RepID=UPI003D0D5A5A
MSGQNKILLPLAGFISAAIMTTSLSTFVLFVGYFSLKLNVSVQSLILWGNIIYFVGMPIGKIIGRYLKFYRNLSTALLGITILISLTIALMPFVKNFVELMIFRFLQGMVTIYMEVFSNVYSFLYDKITTRNLASAVSISGIPAGVAIGTSAYILTKEDPITIFTLFSLLSLASSILYILLIRKNIFVMNKLKEEIPGTTYRYGRTWLMGLLWATIAGGNLVLSIVLPQYISMYSPNNITLAMQTFGYSAALFTVIGGIIMYYSKSLNNMVKVVTLSYLLSFIGFLIIWYDEPKYMILTLAILLINMEAFAVPFIYSIPRYLYPEKLVAKGTWEFALIGSSFHIWSSILALEIGFYFDFRMVMFMLAFPPLYGVIFSLLIPKLIKNNIV